MCSGEKSTKLGNKSVKPGLHGNDDGAPLRREEGAPLGTDRRAEGRQTNILIRRSAQEAVLGKCCKWQTHTQEIG